MRLDLSASINGRAVTKLAVWVANVGPWHADVDMPGGAAVSGDVTIKLGTLALRGTVDPEHSGTFGEATRVRVVAGAGGWDRQLPAKHYHNDAGVKSELVAQDAAREAGETLGTFTPQFERLGRDFVRDAGTASRAVELAAGYGIAWHVDYEGVTHVGARTPSEIEPGAYHVMAYDARARMATLGTRDPGRIVIGSILSAHLDVPGVVRELQIRADESELRIVAWLGGSDGGAGKLATLMREIAVRATDGHLFGTYRYRVVRMAPGDAGRVELQAVRKIVGLPDIAPVSVWPGVAGVHAELAAGAEVLVCFVDGDRTQPVVTHFAGRDGVGFIPNQLTIGGQVGAPAARQGDAVDVLLPPAIFSGTIGGAPASGVLTWPLSKTLGIITGHSTKVKIG